MPNIEQKAYVHDFSYIYRQQAIDRTIDTDVRRQQVHFQVVVAGFNVVECLIIDSQATLRFAGTQCTENIPSIADLATWAQIPALSSHTDRSSSDRSGHSASR